VRDFAFASSRKFIWDAAAITIADKPVLAMSYYPKEGNPLWEKYSTVQKSTSIPLVMEIVSSNWRDDYLTKVKDYEEIGIKEYWIVDYLGLGGRRYIGNPKQPTISIHSLVDDEYQVTQFRENDAIISPVFPSLKLTVEQIFNCDS